MFHSTYRYLLVFFIIIPKLPAQTCLKTLTQQRAGCYAAKQTFWDHCYKLYCSKGAGNEFLPCSEAERCLEDLERLNSTCLLSADQGFQSCQMHRSQP